MAAADRAEIASLAEQAAARTWSPDALPWESAVDWSAVSVPEQASVLGRSDVVRAMSGPERARLRQREMASHLAALANGERRAVNLAAETVLLCPEEDVEQRWFLGTLLADESKHDLALHRFLREKLAYDVRPHPVLDALFATLTSEQDYELNLLAGQVVLEGAAASLLNGLLLGVDQPLLRDLLRHIGRDEARHIRFAHAVSRPLSELSPARRRRMEDVLFEAAHAAVVSLVPDDAWQEIGLDRGPAREATVDALRERGVLAFFTKVLARELGGRGFPAEDLRATLERHLEARLRRAA